MIHGMGDPKEMLRELEAHVFEVGIVGGKLEADLDHVLTEQCYPGSTVCLLEIAARGQLCAAVEDSDVIQSKETAFKQVLTKAVFAVHPPAEVQRQLRKRPFEEIQIILALDRLLGPVQEDRGPGMYGRIDIAEVPLVGRYLTGGMQVQLL